MKLPILFLATCFVLLSCTKTKKEYYPNGNLQSETELRNGKKNGIEKIFYPNGMLLSQATYKNDSLEGKYISNFPSGKAKEISQYKNNKKDGLMQEFDENGKLITSIQFRDNKKHGNYEEFYPNGLTRTKGKFANDLFDGLWEYYDQVGSKVGEGRFVSGSGSQVSFFRNSVKPRVIIHYKAGEKDGLELEFNEKGDTLKVIQYKKGKVITSTSK